MRWLAPHPRAPTRWWSVVETRRGRTAPPPRRARARVARRRFGRRRRFLPSPPFLRHTVARDGTGRHRDSGRRRMLTRRGGRLPKARRRETRSAVACRFLPFPAVSDGLLRETRSARPRAEEARIRGFAPSSARRAPRAGIRLAQRLLSSLLVRRRRSCASVPAQFPDDDDVPSSPCRSSGTTFTRMQLECNWNAIVMQCNVPACRSSGTAGGTPRGSCGRRARRTPDRSAGSIVTRRRSHSYTHGRSATNTSSYARPEGLEGPEEREVERLRG